MFYFHMKFNCKKNYKDYCLTIKEWTIVDKDIDYLHSSMNVNDFENRKNIVINKWNSNGWVKWVAYFNKQWLENIRFNNWQMFHVPPGYPNTNNPIESFNKLVKLVYTNYYVTTIYELLEGLRDKLIFKLSSFPKEFCYYRAPTSAMLKKAKLINEKAILKTNEDTFYYHKHDKLDPSKVVYNKYCIQRFDNKVYPHFDFFYCSCYSFYKYYVCKHIVKVCDLFNYKLKGYTKIKVFATNSKRGPKNKKQNPLEDA